MTLRSIEIHAADPPQGAGFAGWLIVPRPVDAWGQRLESFEIDGAAAVREIGSANSDCRALCVRVADPERGVRVRVDVAICDGGAPDWAWRAQSNRYTRASDQLAAHARALCDGAVCEQAALRRLIDDAASIFAYGHVDQPFNHGEATVPTVCGTNRGSCVDINTYLLAGARAVGIRGQYVAGYWFHPEKTRTQDMHCWLAFEPDGQLEFWDVAHGLKWADTLGAKVEEGLNPAGGRRVTMSFGRGLVFDTPMGRAEISHFSEPVWLVEGADGRADLVRPSLVIDVVDPDGVRTQTPLTPSEAAA